MVRQLHAMHFDGAEWSADARLYTKQTTADDGLGLRSWLPAALRPTAQPEHIDIQIDVLGRALDYA